MRLQNQPSGLKPSNLYLLAYALDETKKCVDWQQQTIQYTILTQVQRKENYLNTLMNSKAISAHIIGWEKRIINVNWIDTANQVHHQNILGKKTTDF